MSVRRNEFNQPIGEEMVNWTKRPFPGDMVYEGNYTIVTRLSHAHIEPLFDVYKTSHRSNWTYLPEEPPVDFDTFKQTFTTKVENKQQIYYVVINKETNAPVGVFSLMRIDEKNGVIEVGNVNFSDQLRQTAMSTEAHYLLAKYVFEELEYRRYEWKCDSLNAPSIQTAQRLGFVFEGTFRNAIVYKNRSRNTNWFSMLIEEWPVHKNAFEKWLAKDNFDDEGKQIRKLASFK